MAAAAIGKLIGGLGLPHRLANVNVGEHLFKRANPIGRANPRSIAGAADVVEILRLAA